MNGPHNPFLPPDEGDDEEPTFRGKHLVTVRAHPFFYMWKQFWWLGVAIVVNLALLIMLPGLRHLYIFWVPLLGVLYTLGWLLIKYLHWVHVEYEVTSLGISGKHFDWVFFANEELDNPVNKFDTIYKRQPILLRLFDVGTIIIDRGSPDEIKMEYIREYKKVKKVILDLRAEYLGMRTWKGGRGGKLD